MKSWISSIVLLLGAACLVAPGAGAPGRSSAQAASSPNFMIDWYSINSGGDVDVASPSYRSGVSIGQAVGGEAASASYRLGMGFWYGISTGEVDCPIIVDGDVNESGNITSADIIFLVNFVFKSGPTPLPCAAAGDVNCNGSVNSSDIISMVNHVFKGGPQPCDVCTLINVGTWTCP